MSENAVTEIKIQDVFVATIKNCPHLEKTLAMELSIFNIISLSSTCHALRKAVYKDDRFGQAVSDAFREKLSAAKVAIDFENYTVSDDYTFSGDSFWGTRKEHNQKLPPYEFPEGKMSGWDKNYQKEAMRYFSIKVLEHHPTWYLYLDNPLLDYSRFKRMVSLHSRMKESHEFRLEKVKNDPGYEDRIKQVYDFLSVFVNVLIKIDDIINNYGRVAPFHGNLGNIYTLLVNGEMNNESEAPRTTSMSIKGDGKKITIGGRELVIPDMILSLITAEDPRIVEKCDNMGFFDEGLRAKINSRMKGVDHFTYMAYSGKVKVVSIVMTTGKQSVSSF